MNPSSLGRVPSVRLVSLATLVAAALGVGCSSESSGGSGEDGGAGDFPGSGGASGATGGATGNGGATGSSGAPGSGGRRGSGGAGSNDTGGTGQSGDGGATNGSGGASGDGGAASSGGASGTGGSGTGGTGPGNATRWRYAYHPCYQWGEVAASAVPWASLTHLGLGYLWPANGGSGTTLDAPPGVCGDLSSIKSKVAAYVTAGHAAGKKVTMMLGGAGGNPGGIWNTATTAGNVGAFAQNIVDVLKGLNLDGVDIDWENDVDGPGMVRLAKELRNRWADGVITIPTGFNGDDASKYADAKDAVDAFMPMTYLQIDQWGGWIIPIPLTPLYQYQSNPYSIELVRTRWAAAGVPADKLVMGVGGFGMAWTDTNNDGRAPIAPYVSSNNGPADSENGASMSDNSVTQKWVSATLAAHADLVEAWDDVGKCSYWHAPAANSPVSVAGPNGGTVKVGSIYYETPRSMGEKVAYVDTKGMKGMMFWTLSQMLKSDGTSPVLDAASQ